MNIRKKSRITVASICTLAILGLQTGVVSATEKRNTQAFHNSYSITSYSGNTTASYFVSDVVADVDSELTALGDMPVDLQELKLKEGLGLVQAQTRVAPLAIVFALGCAVGVGGAIFNTTWSSASSVAWSLAGALVSCIPGAKQAQLVSVILKHKKIIAKALKMVGASAAAAALLGGDSPR